MTETLVVIEPVVTVIAAGQQGPRGPIGPPGDANSAFTATEALSGHRAVCATTAGDGVRLADPANLERSRVIGVTTGAAAYGAETIVRISGQLIEPTWTWAPGLPIWLGAAGVLTQSIPISGHQVRLGLAVSATAMLIAIDPPLQLT